LVSKTNCNEKRSKGEFIRISIFSHLAGMKKAIQQIDLPFAFGAAQAISII